jgi:MoaA/NifB/PqqE/SkfB family radical SAM enzyme
MPQEDMHLDAFLTALDRLPELKSLELQGEGEPLLNKNYFKMVSGAVDKEIQVFTITNGSLFTAENISCIMTSGLSKVSVSIESADAGKFRRLRGGVLNKVKLGLQDLVLKKRSNVASMPPIGLAVTVLRNTIGDLPGIINFYHELDLDGGISFQVLEGMHSYSKNYDRNLLDNLWSSEEISLVYKTIDQTAGIEKIKEDGRGAPGFYTELFRGWKPESISCPWLEKGVFVARDGSLTACCLIKDVDRYAFGNIHTSSAEAIDLARMQMRNSLNAGVVPKPCRGCRVISTIESAIGPLTYSQT